MNEAQAIAQYEAEQKAIAQYEAEKRDEANTVTSKYAGAFERPAAQQNALNFAGGMASGGLDVLQGVGNMIGLVDDDSKAGRKADEAEIFNTDSKSFKGGDFTGETLSLAPAGLISKFPQLAKLGKTGAVMAEGALSGAILADPNERGEGAVLGGLTSAALTKTMGALSRVVKDGLVKQGPSAKRLKELIKKMTGKEPFIPATLAAGAEDGVSKTFSKAGQGVGLIPGVGGRMKDQENRLLRKWYEAVLRQTQAGVGKKGDEIADIFKGNRGDVLRTLDDQNLVRPLNKTQETLYDLAATKHKGRFSPAELEVTAAQAGKADFTGSYQPMREIAMAATDVFGGNLTSQGIAERGIFNVVQDVGGKQASLGPMLSFLGSEGVQKFMLGDNASQQLLKKYMATKSGAVLRELMSRVRNGMAAQAGEGGSEVNTFTEELRNGS